MEKHSRPVRSTNNALMSVHEQIAGVAAMFGCRPAALYPLIEPYSLGDGALVDDRALFCGGGPSLTVDSAPFGRPDRGGRTSPWFQVAPLMLHTVESARERYRIWAANEWEKANSGPRSSVLGSDGEYHELPRPKNPYAA
jgi:hypothetical protein